MRLVQIERKSGIVHRVKAGVTPTLDLSLNDNQRVVNLAMNEVFPNSHRKTSDWRWIAYIETAQEVKR